MLGMGLLVLPVIAHWLNRHARRHIVFPSIELLAASAATHSYWHRLRRWLLLLLRCLTVFWIVWAFARPVWVGPETQPGNLQDRVAAVILLDTSLSTTQQTAGVPLFETMRASAVRAIDELRPGKDVANVVCADARPDALFSQMSPNLQVVRREEVDNLAPVLSRLDSAIAEGQALKLGGSSTVAQIEHAGRSLVIKRYNIKGFFHWLKRFWRPSRAWHSWQEGNRLDFLGIGTPRPLAIVERRTLWLRRGAYLVTEHCSCEDIISRFRPYAEATGSAARPSDAELAALDQLFSAMLRERISHGDLKGTNVLWQDGRWLLIDLDAMQQHGSAHSFSGAYSRDRARFLRNWPQQSELYQLLDQRIPKTSELPEH